MFWICSRWTWSLVPASRTGFLWIGSCLNFSLPSKADIQPPPQALESCVLDDTGQRKPRIESHARIVVMVTLLGSSPARPLHNLKKNPETLRDEELPLDVLMGSLPWIARVCAGKKNAWKQYLRVPMLPAFSRCLLEFPHCTLSSGGSPDAKSLS